MAVDDDGGPDEQGVFFGVIPERLLLVDVVCWGLRAARGSGSGCELAAERDVEGG